MEYIAHIGSAGGEEHLIQSLDDHLAGVAELAASFAGEFNNEEWGRTLGLWHDLGKHSSEFQQYIRVNSGYEEDDQRYPKTDHTSAGAIHSVKQLGGMGYPLAYAIAGHHAGLLNWHSEIGFVGDLGSRLKKLPFYDAVIGKIDRHLMQKPSLNKPCGMGVDQEGIHLWIRMLFSCLVDADYLDTENFMNPTSSEMRRTYQTLYELKELLVGYMEQLQQEATATPVNQVRAQILSNCRSNGRLEPGFFSITVPTGGGKTLSSMTWALEHAVKYGKCRVVFAIPYTSIITQTAEVYRKIFGANNVVEHHSNVLDEANTVSGKLASENWDAPIVVTTNVQLFESLFSNRPSQCRKLHNLANSIIVLDEAQMLPPEFLRPILASLKQLVACYGVSVLLSTATQPAFEGIIGLRDTAFRGIEAGSIREIAGNMPQLADALKRVRIEMPNNLNEVITTEEIAAELLKYDQVLCIVNTRKECKAICSHMPDDTLHLSRLMCTAHIMDTIASIKDMLRNGTPLRVVSTQLVEAGVDIDFPIVYRAFAGLDSIAQSAGRNNREGKLATLGVTRVFCGEHGVPPGLMRKGADAAKVVAAQFPPEKLLTSEAYNAYFKEFYSRVNSFDKPRIKELLEDGAFQMQFQFATAAHSFRLIDDKGAKAIVVLYGNGADLVDELKRLGPSAWLNRKLQHYTVTVGERDFNELVKSGAVEQVHGYWLQASAWLYSSRHGLANADEWMNEILIA